MCDLLSGLYKLGLIMSVCKCGGVGGGWGSMCVCVWGANHECVCVCVCVCVYVRVCAYRKYVYKMLTPLNPTFI